MKKILLILGLLFAFPSCQFTPESSTFVESVGRPIAVIQVKKFIEKKPSNRLKIVDLTLAIEGYSDRDLELKDFIELSKLVKLGSDWAIVMDSIYNSYKDKFTISDKQKAEKVKSYILWILKDAVLLADPQK